VAELYLDYERIKIKYTTLQEQFAHVLLEKERLYTRTLPSAIRYDKDKVMSTVDGNPLEDFVISVEDKALDEKIVRFRELMKDWAVLLEVKEGELRRSKDIFNRIYVLKYLDNYSVSRIAKVLHYERTQIYRKLKQMWKRCNKMQQDTSYNGIVE
jgi:hypothetical protein